MSSRERAVEWARERERERERGKETRRRRGEREKLASARRTDDGGERAARESGCNESEKDDEIGLCRRRRDSTERAGVPQTGRRLSGMQAPLPFLPLQAVGPGLSWSLRRSDSRLRATPRAAPSRSLLCTELPYGAPAPASAPAPPWYRDFTIHAPLPSPITARKRKCERSTARATSERAGIRSRTCTCICVYASICASRRRYVTSSHGNQCSWPPTRSHGAKPTRPASFGHLCASALNARPLTCLSLFLLFLIFLPLLHHRGPSRARVRVRFSSCEPYSLLFLLFFSSVLSSRPPLCIFPRCFVKIMPCMYPRAIFQYLQKSIRRTLKKCAREFLKM